MMNTLGELYPREIQQEKAISVIPSSFHNWLKRLKGI